MQYELQTESKSLTVSQISWGCDGKTIIDDVSFEVAPGRMVGVLGPNGVGKSTLLRCLYRYLTPSQGQVAYGGKAIGKYSQRQFAREVAVVLQHSPQGFQTSVAQLLSTGLLARKSFWQWADPKADTIAIDEVLERVGLLDKRELRFDLLSGGEQQRVLIARALLQQPSLLLLDEPTNHLDVRYQIEVLKLVKSLGISVVTTIHDLNLAAAFCDDVLLLEHGKVAAFGSPKEVLSPRRISRVYGVDSQVDNHPQGKHPRITFRYGEVASDAH